MEVESRALVGLDKGSKLDIEEGHREQQIRVVSLSFELWVSILSGNCSFSFGSFVFVFTLISRFYSVLQNLGLEFHESDVIKPRSIEFELNFRFMVVWSCFIWVQIDV